MTDKKGSGRSGKQPNKGCKRIVVGTVVLVVTMATGVTDVTVAHLLG